MQGAKTKPPRKGESEADKAKEKFKARHAKNIAKGKQTRRIGLTKLSGLDKIGKFNPAGLCQKKTSELAAPEQTNAREQDTSIKQNRSTRKKK